MGSFVRQAVHGDGEAIGGHVVRGHGNVFVTGGGIVALDMAALEKLAAGWQMDGGAALHAAARGAPRGAARGRGDDAPIPAADEHHAAEVRAMDEVVHGNGEAIGGHVVRGHGNVFVTGGGTVALNLAALQKLAAGGGDALHAAPPRGVQICAQAARGRGAAPIAAGVVAAEESALEKMRRMIRPVTTCLLFGIGLFLGLCIRYAPSPKYKTAAVVLLILFASVATSSLMVIFVHHEGSNTEKDFSAWVTISLFFWLFLSIGVFMCSSFAHFHPAIPATVMPELMIVLLVYWSKTFAHPQCLRRLMTGCCKGAPPNVEPRRQQEEEEEQEHEQEQGREQDAPGHERGADGAHEQEELEPEAGADGAQQ